MGRVLETVIVCVCLLALAGWMAWQWLFSGEDDRLTGAPAFSTRRRRDIQAAVGVARRSVLL